MRETDHNLILKVMFGLVEKSIEKTILILKKERNEESLFSIELFKSVLKIETYNLCTSDFYYEEVQELVKNLKIDYNIYDKKKPTDEDNEDNFLEDEYYEGDYEDNEIEYEEIEEEESQKDNNSNISNLIGNDNVSMLLDFPLSDIVEIINAELDASNTETIDLTKDLNLIENIWDQWIPETVDAKMFKEMIQHFISSIQFS